MYSEQRRQFELLHAENAALKRRYGASSSNNIQTIGSFHVHVKYHESNDNLLAAQPLKQDREYKHNSGTASAVAYSRCGSVLATCGGTHVELYRENLTTTSVETDSQLRSIRFTADGQTLIGGGTSGVVVWDVMTGNRRHQIAGSPALTVDVSADSQIFASGSTDKIVRVFNAGSGKLVKTLGDSDDTKNGTIPIHTVSFCPSPSPSRLAAADSVVRVWDVEAGGPLAKFGNLVTTCCYSNDARAIVTGDSRGSVCAFDARSPDRSVVQFGAHPGSNVKSVAYAPCNRWILSVGDDGNLVFSDLRLGLPVMQIDAAMLPLESVAHSPVKRMFAAAVSDGTTKVWSYAN